MIDHIVEHWVEIIAVLGAVNIICSIIVEWTPWKWDNEALVRIRQGLLFLAGRVGAARHVVRGRSKAEISLAELDEASQRFIEDMERGGAEYYHEMFAVPKFLSHRVQQQGHENKG